MSSEYQMETGEMVTKKSTRQRLREYMKRHNIQPTAERNDLKVKVVQSDVVKVRGSMHIGADRISKRKDVDKSFRKKFA